MPENKELWFVGDFVKGQAEVGSRINMIPNVGVPILWKLCSELVIGKVSVQFSRSFVSNSATSWTTARQASLSITNFQSPPKLMSIVSVMPSNHLILCHPLLLRPSIFPSIWVFSNEWALRIKWPKYW